MNNQEVKVSEENTETKESKPIEVNKKDTARNKNVFGSLMNHLKRAKNLLESEQNRVREFFIIQD
jgi:hypothetical protein